MIPASVGVHVVPTQISKDRRIARAKDNWYPHRNWYPHTFWFILQKWTSGLSSLYIVKVGTRRLLAAPSSTYLILVGGRGLDVFSSSNEGSTVDAFLKKQTNSDFEVLMKFCKYEFFDHL